MIGTFRGTRILTVTDTLAHADLLAKKVDPASRENDAMLSTLSCRSLGQSVPAMVVTASRSTLTVSYLASGRRVNFLLIVHRRFEFSSRTRPWRTGNTAT